MEFLGSISLHHVGLAWLYYIAWRLLCYAWRSYQFGRFKAAQGTAEPQNLSGVWPFSLLDGLSRLRRVVNMRKSNEDLLDDIIGGDFKVTSTSQRTRFEGTNALFTIDPANIQAILATKFADFELGETRVNQFFPMLGRSIFTSNGRFWEHSRALFRPQFNRENINDMESTESAARELIDAIEKESARMDGHLETELLPLLSNFTLDTATSFLFGASANSQQGDQTKGDENLETRQFREDFELTSQYILKRIRLQSVYWMADGLHFRRATRRIRSFADQFARRALNGNRTSERPTEKYNLLSALVAQCQDREELCNQTLAILLAGRDSTAALLGWCFTRLALHPEVFHELRSIILEEFERQDDLTFAKLKGCRPLQHFLNEVLRLHPVIPLNNRQAVRDTVLPRGGGPNEDLPIAVRKGQVISFCPYLMHRRADLWGDDALSFRPGRWENRVPAWQYLPFSGGPRVCIGQQFALIEASFLIVKMLQRYDAIEPVNYEEMIALKKGLGLTMWPADRVKVRLHRA